MEETWNEHDDGADCHCIDCADKPRCPNCARDYEGCECSAAEGGIGHDSFREDER